MWLWPWLYVTSHDVLSGNPGSKSSVSTTHKHGNRISWLLERPTREIGAKGPARHTVDRLPCSKDGSPLDATVNAVSSLRLEALLNLIIAA
jgi:hypothetical protein